jgi:poly(A) polymerase
LQIHFNKTEDFIVKTISDCADQMNVPTYLIGGYVRDKILNRETDDIDVVCLGSGIALAESVARSLKIRKPTIFKTFGTAMIKYSDIEIEFVGARKESYQIDSRKPAVEEGSIEDDQNRRDFTINALAYSLNKNAFGTFLDPFDGLTDLSAGLIRTPLDPNKTFSDDPLRMLRAIRFATQLNFRIDDITFQGIIDNKERIKIVSVERIIVELNKIILSPIPSIGFIYLLDSGLIELIFPEMYDLRGAEYVDGKGHKDNYYHTIQVLDNVAKKSDDLWLRWAAILHDIGKPSTKWYSKKVGWTFHGHDAVGAGMTPGIFRRFKLPMDQKMHFVKNLVRLHLRPISLTKEDITDSAIRRLLFEAGEDIDALMILCEADITTKNDQKMRRFLQNYEIVKLKMKEIEERDHLRNWQPPISGEDIMDTFNIPPSRIVGDIKNAIREAILDGNIENNYEDAHSFMLTIAKEMGINLS